MVFFSVAVVCNSVKINVRLGQKIIFGNCFSNDLLFSHVATFQLLNQKSRIVWSFWTLPIKNVETYFDIHLFVSYVSFNKYLGNIVKGFERKQTTDFIYRSTCKLKGNLCWVICNAIFGLWKELMPMTKSHVVIRLKQWCAWKYQKLRHRMRNFSAYMPSSLIFISLPLLIIHTSLSIYDEYPHYWGGTCLHV